ncbi:MAG: ATP-binding protein [Candidatus Brocadiia bacterium]
MITSINVNGFRSLSDFSLDLRPGLNILVGPNGSGKTNIITFFEFLSHLILYGPSEAVNQLGGAGSVFTKLSGDEFEKHIKVKLYGCAEISSHKYIKYCYSFTIAASENFDSIGFKEQELVLQKSSVFSQSNYMHEKSFCIKQNVVERKKQVISTQNYKKQMVDSSFLPPPMRNKITNDKTIIEDFLRHNDKDAPLVNSLAFLVEVVRFVAADLRGGQIFNIVPSRVKQPEESSSPVGIKKDGSGLAATLYAIINKKKHQGDIFFPGRFVIRRYTRDVDLKHTSIGDIVKYLKTANAAINKIDVVNDRFDNLLKIRFWIEKKDVSTMLPLSAMSDGTVKWLTLVTAILTSPSIFSLEEPENFLHPLMQSEVVKLMRHATEGRKKKTSIFMSTHSETILNNATPSEVVVISFEGGRSRADRCSNQNELREEIKRTGFGLGFYYISGSLTNE